MHLSEKRDIVKIRKRLSNIKQNGNACFTVVNDVCLLPSTFSAKYSSAILFGTISAVEDDKEKRKGLEELIKKLAPDYMESGLKYIANSMGDTTVLKMEVKEMTGKAKK